MPQITIPQAGFEQSARYSSLMRASIVLAELVAMAVAVRLSLFSDVVPAMITCSAQVLSALLAGWWLSRFPPRNPWPVTLTLASDLALLGIWLHFTGGYTNPLTSLLLLPLAIAIILVPMTQSLLLAGFAVMVYRLLMDWYRPVRELSNLRLEQLHLHGMWVAFILTAIVLLLVVGSLARRLRQQQALLAQVRENRLRDEQIIALGLSAATVAHRIGTPLNTMTLLVEEMRSRAPECFAADLELVDKQLQVCSKNLQHLANTAAQVRDANPEIVAVEDWLSRLRESATLLWPASNIEWAATAPGAQVSVDATLDQAMLNIIANALRASPRHVRVSARRQEDRIAVLIEDHGRGLDERVQAQPGQQIAKPATGLGIGLFLSNATIQRLGGELQASVDPSGTSMMILLPEQRHAA